MHKDIENKLMEFLQYNIVITRGEKPYRRGRLITFKIYDFYIKMNFSYKGKNRKIDLPLPYKLIYNEENKELIFSYKLSDMTMDYELVKELYDDYPEKGKLYNSYVVIKIEEQGEIK